jgi:hypothetical protein
MTPTELAVRLAGPKQGYSRSKAARRVRKIARDLYGLSGGRWYFTADQVDAISGRF